MIYRNYIDPIVIWTEHPESVDLTLIVLTLAAAMMLRRRDGKHNGAAKYLSGLALKPRELPVLPDY
jgi:hypothetical protein